MNQINKMISFFLKFKFTTQMVQHNKQKIKTNNIELYYL